MNFRGPASWKQINIVNLKFPLMLIHMTPVDSSPRGEKISEVPLGHGLVAEAGAA